jgi:hypothetical protein
VSVTGEYRPLSVTGEYRPLSGAGEYRPLSVTGDQADGSSDGYHTAVISFWDGAG